jgi:hypothetical protein
MALNIFGDAPQSLTGLLGEQATEDLRKKAMTTGLINAAIGYIAQPKTGGYGSALPYIGRALMAGQQGAQGVYEGAITDFERQQKIEEFKRKQEQRKAFEAAVPNLMRTTPAQFESITTPGGYAPQQTEVMPGQVSPNFGMTRLPDVTTQREIAPARTEFDNQALMNLAMQFPEQAAPLISSIKSAKDLTKQDKADLIKIGRGEVVYDPTTNQYVAQGLGEEKKPKDFGNDLESIATSNFAPYGRTFNELNPKEQQEAINLANANRRSVAAAGVPSQQPGFKDAGELRKEYNALPQVKAFSEIQNAFDQIKTGISATSAAGDLTAATKFMKLLDPGSVVRESELGMAMAATGVLDRALAYKDFIAKGTKLSVAQRADFLNVAQQLYNAAAARKREIDTQYADIANVGGLDPKLVIGSPATQGAVRNKIMQELQRRQGQK